MKIKNISNKIINVGVLQVLPEEAETLPKEYENHPVIELLQKMKMVELVAEKKATAKSKDVKADAKAEDKAE